MIKMPHINKELESTRTRLSNLESGMVKSSNMLGFNIDVDAPKEDHGAEIQNIKSSLEQTIAELQAIVEPTSRLSCRLEEAVGLDQVNLA
jgi:hypothetical protein